MQKPNKRDRNVVLKAKIFSNVLKELPHISRFQFWLSKPNITLFNHYLRKVINSITQYPFNIFPNSSLYLPYLLAIKAMELRKCTYLRIYPIAPSVPNQTNFSSKSSTYLPYPTDFVVIYVFLPAD